jgi:excisionase family DNA binding protein
MDDETIAAFAARLVPYLSQLAHKAASGEHLAYTVASLAAELGVSPKAIRCAISRGELNAVKRGTRWIISGEAVGEWASAADEKPTLRRRGCPNAPKAAGPSLHSVFCEDTADRVLAPRRPR